MQSQPFEGSKLKIARGRQHIAELEAEITAYLKDDPHAMLLQLDTRNGAYRIALKCRRGVPGAFSTIFGDAVHNFRTALDILANDLVALSGAQPEKVYFPFGKDIAGFETELKAKMGTAAPDIQDIVRSFKPYIGGNEVLRAMHDLDIGDKHIAIIGIGQGGMTGGIPVRKIGAEALAGGGGRLTYEADFGAIRTVPIDLTGFPDAPDEAFLTTIGKLADSELRCTINKGLPLAGTPVVEALNDMGNMVQSIVETFEAHCNGGH